MVSFHEPIPKKPCKDAKNCSLCKKHGGVHVTHNISDCCKYNKDGKLKKGFGKSQHCSTASDKKTASAFAQLLAKIAKLQKANEKFKKSLCKSECDNGSNSDDSNSS